MTKVDYTLSGCANGHPVRIVGKGTATPRVGRVRLAAVEASVTFDTGLAHLVGLDVVTAVVAGLAVAPDGPLVARCRADLFGEGGVEVGTIAAVATVARHRGRLACRAQLTDARVALEPGERVVSIDERTITAVLQSSGVALFAVTTVATSRGREFTALATAFLVEASVGRRRDVTLSAMAVARQGAAVVGFGAGRSPSPIADHAHSRSDQ